MFNLTWGHLPAARVLPAGQALDIHGDVGRRGVCMVRRLYNVKFCHPERSKQATDLTDAIQGGTATQGTRVGLAPLLHLPHCPPCAHRFLLRWARFATHR